MLKNGLDLAYASLSVGWERHKQGQSWLRWPAVAAAAAYYLMFPRDAAERAQQVMQEKVDLQFVKSVWLLLDSPMARQLSWLKSPRLRTNRPTVMRDVECHIFADDDVPEEFSNEPGPFPLRQHADASLLGIESDVSLASQGGQDSPSNGMIATSGSGDHGHDGDDERGEGDAEYLGDADLVPAREKQADRIKRSRSVLLYIHGGGFVGTSFGVDSGMLASWAKQDPNLTIVFVHYSLSPAVRFPVALDEIMRVYKQLRSWSKRLVVMGESAGGNLAAALAVRCVQERVRNPD